MKPADRKNKKNTGPVKKTSPSAPAGKLGADLFNTYGYYIFFGLALLILIIVFKDYLLFKKLYLFTDIGSDSTNIFLSSYYQAADYIKNEGIPGWSFQQGMGQNIFPFSISDPFNIFLYMMGKENLSYAIVYGEALKILLGGTFFYLYVKALTKSPYASIVGGVLYAFGGYMILGSSGWYQMPTEMVWAALLLYSFEKFLQEDKWYLIPIPVIMIASLQPFFLYPYGIMMGLYSVARYIAYKGSELKPALLFFGKLLTSCILGLLVCGVFFGTNLFQLLQSPRVSGDSAYFEKLSSQPMFKMADPIEYISILCRAFSNDLLGTGNDFKGWSNYLESPIIYTGIIMLLLAPVSFTFFSKQKRKVYLIFAAILLLPLVFPYFRHLFYGFAGDYYRTYSFFISFILMFLGIQTIAAIDKKEKLKIKALLITALVLLVLLYMPYDVKNKIINTGIRSAITVYLLLYILFLVLLSLEKTKHMAKYMLLAVVCIEAAHFSKITTNKRSVISSREHKERIFYNDYTKEAVTFLKKYDQSFYRVNKDYSSGPAIHSSLNDAQIFGFFGSQCYSSLNQKYYIQFLQGTNTIPKGREELTRWAPGVSQRLLLQAITSHKYFFTKSNARGMVGQGMDSIAKFGDVVLMKNKFSVPLGITYTDIVKDTVFKRFSDFRKDISLLRALVPAKEDMALYSGMNEYTFRDTLEPLSFENYSKWIAALKTDTLRINEFSNNHISGKIKTDRKKVLFLSIPYDEGWKMKHNGKEEKPLIVDYGLMGVILEKGEHAIELNYEVPYLKKGLMASASGILIYGLLFYLFVIRKRSNSSNASVVL